MSMSSWLHGKEIYFRTVASALLAFASLCVTIAAVLISKEQLKTSGEQSALMKEQAGFAAAQRAVMDEQTKLFKLQAQAAQAQISPRFLFNLGGGEPLSSPLFLIVENHGSPTRGLRGKSIVYLALKNGRNVELKNYNGGSEAATIRSGKLWFYHSKYLNGWTTSAFIADPLHQFEECQYLRLDYFDLAGQPRTEHYTMDTTGACVAPVDGPPVIDATFDLGQFGEKKNFDEAKAKSALLAVVDPLLKN